jgi:translation initiation factor 1
VSRGKKLDIFIGADFDDEWSEVKTSSEKKAPSEKKPPQKHQLYFAKEKRRGKVVTLVGEFFLAKEDAIILLKKLKKQLGCGGSYKAPIMEFQGDIKTKVRELLLQEGFAFKQKH